jgi:acyl-coenzyme A thioesterase PaaI-like protein
MTTVSLNVNFMRAVREGDVIVTARVRMGRNLAFGQVERASTKMGKWSSMRAPLTLLS